MEIIGFEEKLWASADKLRNKSKIINRRKSIMGTYKEIQNYVKNKYKYTPKLVG